MLNHKNIYSFLAPDGLETTGRFLYGVIPGRENVGQPLSTGWDYIYHTVKNIKSFPAVISGMILICN